MNNQQSRFDEAAAQWDSNPVRVELARAVGEAIACAIPLHRDWRVLDYGAGTGLVTLNLQPRVASIVAMDASTGMLSQLEQKLATAGIDNIRPRLWNLESDAFPENGFDLATTSMTMHHVRDVPLVLSRLAALLKPGAWLAMADLEAEDGSFHGASDDVFHTGFEPQQIRTWLDGAGFEDVEVRKVHEVKKPSAISGELRPFGVFLATGRKHQA